MFKQRGVIDLNFMILSTIVIVAGLIVGYMVGYERGHASSQLDRCISKTELEGCEDTASSLSKQLMRCVDELKGDE